MAEPAATIEDEVLQSAPCPKLFPNCVVPIVQELGIDPRTRSQFQIQLLGHEHGPHSRCTHSLGIQPEKRERFVGDEVRAHCVEDQRHAATGTGCLFEERLISGFGPQAWVEVDVLV